MTEAVPPLVVDTLAMADVLVTPASEVRGRLPARMGEMGLRLTSAAYLAACVHCPRQSDGMEVERHAAKFELSGGSIQNCLLVFLAC